MSNFQKHPFSISSPNPRREGHAHSDVVRVHDELVQTPLTKRRAWRVANNMLT